MTEQDALLASNQNKRRPYHYSNRLDNTSINNASEASEEFWSERANYSRYLYYNRLRREADPNDEELLLIPPHVIPSEFFYPQFMYSSDGKQSSLVTIFALWNTMMGTSLLSMPWALEKSGVIPGVVLICAMAGVCFYTAYRMLETYEAHQGPSINDLAVLCKRLLGRWAQVFAVLFSALTLLGASIVYWVLMSNFLYHTVDFIHSSSDNQSAFNTSGELDVFCPSYNDSDTDAVEDDDFHKYWDLYRTVPLFLIAIIGPLASIRSTSFFTKFNSLGTLSVMYLLVFVIVKWSKYGMNVNMDDPTSINYMPLYKSGFPALAGMLSLAFFIHNCILTIMRNNRVPEKNGRDLGIAYLFVAMTYCIIGGAFYIIFPLEKSCISDNFLNNFKAFDRWAFTARIFLFFQMITVFPLLVYILRVQVYYAIFKKNPNFIQTTCLNIVIISVCVLFAMKLPQIGTIILHCERRLKRCQIIIVV
ncbi:unnamed protein product [Allacma fusca]|uniref:Amino acid transporter transmembrane domain-containing protein n=1 Tax=Allacma fusca TaxID=39272 RepID=A0A8J2P6V3_9HEXA|nr:unnamed protein product [Allacma fusca]